MSNTEHSICRTFYGAGPGSKDKKVLNMDKIFNLKKRHCE